MARPVFVVGYMHSGTTLLLRALESNPEVFAIGVETRFFDPTRLTRASCYERIHHGDFEGATDILVSTAEKEWGLDVSCIAESTFDFGSRRQASPSPGVLLCALMDRRSESHPVFF